MQGKAVKKVPGGKLVRVTLEYEDTIKDIKITGDFFLHPEDVIEKIEKAFLGLHVPISSQEAVRIIDHVLESNQAELFGVSSHDIVETLKEAL